MSDDPPDFEVGHFFESQKGISDRRAGLGLGRERSGPNESSSDEIGNGGGLINWLILAVLWCLHGFIVHVIPFVLKIVWEILGAIFSSGRRGRRRR